MQIIRRLLVGVSVVTAITFGASHADSAEMHVLSSAKSALSGQLWSGADGLPICGGHVFVLASGMKTMIGHALTPCGNDMGRWQITNLPASGKVYIVGFHPDYKMNLAMAEASLDGTWQDIPWIKTAVNLPDPAWGDLLDLGKEVNTVQANQAAVKLANNLLAQLPGSVAAVPPQASAGPLALAPTTSSATTATAPPATSGISNATFLGGIAGAAGVIGAAVLLAGCGEDSNGSNDGGATPTGGGGSKTTCTGRVGHACNNDMCGHPYRCDADGVIRQIPEANKGTCGLGTPGCTDCGWPGAGTGRSLACGTYTWNVGECHCVD